MEYPAKNNKDGHSNTPLKIPSKSNKQKNAKE